MSTLQPPLITSATVALVYLYLYAMERDRYLGIWAIAFGLWTARYAWGIAATQVQYVDGSIVLPILALARATFILWGALTLYDRGLPRWWFGLIALDLVWLVWVAVAEPTLPFPEGLTHYLIFGGTTLVAGGLFVRAPKVHGPERVIAGGFLAALGALNLLFPFLDRFSPEVVDGLFESTSFVQMGIGFGALLVYFRIARTDRDRLHAQVEAQLTKVISGYVPICSHCKKVREGESWQRIEEYVTERSDASFSHSICPTCYHELYADEFGPLDS